VHEYVFVYDRSSGRFKQRCWVDDGSGPPEDLSKLHGSIPTSGKESWILVQQTKHPTCEVAAMIATSWETVESNFTGLYFYDSDYFD